MTDFETAKSTLQEFMSMVANPKLPVEGGFTEKGIKIRHAIFGVSRIALAVTVHI